MQDTGYPSPWERHSPEWCFSSPLRSNGLSPAPFTGGVSVVSAVEPCPARFKALHRLQQLQIGSPEILALGKQRLAGRFRQSVSKAVSKIQSRGMTAFPEFSPRKARNGKLLRINRNNLDFRPVQEQVEFSACRFAAARFHNDRRFQSVGSREQTSFRFAEQLEKLPSFRLAQEDRQQSRSINDHRNCHPWANSPEYRPDRSLGFHPRPVRRESAGHPCAVGRPRLAREAPSHAVVPARAAADPAKTFL